ncbi:pseudouridine synthase [Nostocoides jenkinsii]|jgi:23S rRNA pseudouridine2605 synthase|uniref:pseudouridine synthase n=1 Tax=Nostocoides jenkinsii TaxID=330834 RepID=UPI00065B4C57|nr:pseudouridine synthase [Tetrasphaera jenkinsii]
MTPPPARRGTGGRPGPNRRPGSPRRTGPANAGTTRKSQPTRPPVERPGEAVDVHDPNGIRLQKLLAASGVGSRRKCEELIAEGRVEVNGQIVLELGIRVPPGAIIHVDGERVQTDPERVYLAFNKPLGVVTTMNDELGRVNVGDYVAQRRERLFHVGRLDADTEGLLLLTNDGELANRLQHPAYGILKTYVAQVPGPIPRDLGKQLREGVELDDGVVRVDSFKLVDSLPGKAIVEVVLHEGRKHIVRRMLEAVGHPVQALARTQVGPVRLGDTKPGKYRPLSAKEIAALYKAAGL